MRHSHATESAVQAKPPTARWWRTRRANEPDRWSSRRRLQLAFLLGAVTAGVALLVVSWSREIPKVEPPFERIVAEGAGPIVEFSRKDARGAPHTIAEWAGHHGIVLFFIATDCPVSNGYAPEMARLARVFGQRGFLFFGIHSAPDVTVAAVAKHAAEYGLQFPVMLDPDQVVTRQAGARVTPEAVVVSPDGQVFYRGRIDDRYTTDGRRRPGPLVHELQSALEAILADESPAVAQTRAFGCPIPARTDAALASEPITFAKHVAPILFKNCVSCHRPGEVAPFSLLTYRDAAKRADFIRDVVESGRMPPWKPHPGAGVFLDATRLSVVEKEILGRWAETGCQPGDPADLPKPPQFPDGWRLGAPDLVLTMPETFGVPADGPDIYRSFALPFPLDHDVTINGIELHPGNRRVVHHSRIYLDDTGDARRRERIDPQPGFSSWYRAGSGLDLPYPGLGGWTPGMTPRFAAAGVGRVIPRGSDVVVQLHYHPIGKPEPDRSSIGLYFARKPVTRNMAGYTLCTDRIEIPPGAKRHKIILSTRIKADVHLYTAVPHAHYLCREFRLAATLPDGTIQPLLWITDWDLDWQDQYRYVKPVRLPKGAIVTLAAYFDNTEENPKNPFKPPRRVRYGVETKDEMCACHLEFLPDDPSGYEAYTSKSPFSL
jgi:peroxiredoxin